MKVLRCLWVAFALIVLVVCRADAQPVSIRIAGWNVEGNGNDINPAVIEDQLGVKQGIDIWGLSEVRPDLFDEFLEGAERGEGAEFDIIEGTTGNNIRLAIIFDTSKVELLGDEELDEPVFANHRAPLVAHFKGKTTGQEFLFMVNHLARGNANARLKQAQFLNDWARDQDLPVIAVGDYNIDFDLDGGDFGDRDPGFDAIVKDDAFEWIRPRVLLKTQASDNFNTVLDFVFVANAEAMRSAGWTGRSVILKRAVDEAATEIDFDDSPSESDHRPVDATFTFNPNRDVDEFNALIERMRILEEQMADVREALEELRDR